MFSNGNISVHNLASVETLPRMTTAFSMSALPYLARRLWMSLETSTMVNMLFSSKDVDYWALFEVHSESCLSSCSFLNYGGVEVMPGPFLITTFTSSFASSHVFTFHFISTSQNEEEYKKYLSINSKKKQNLGKATIKPSRHSIHNRQQQCEDRSDSVEVWKVNE